MNSNQTFPRLCRVLEIYEADFGCEERPDGQETMVCVRLLEGDRVWFDPESGQIEKAAESH